MTLGEQCLKRYIRAAMTYTFPCLDLDQLPQQLLVLMIDLLLLLYRGLTTRQQLTLLPYFMDNPFILVELHAIFHKRGGHGTPLQFRPPIGNLIKPLLVTVQHATEGVRPKVITHSTASWPPGSAFQRNSY